MHTHTHSHPTISSAPIPPPPPPGLSTIPFIKAKWSKGQEKKIKNEGMWKIHETFVKEKGKTWAIAIVQRPFAREVCVHRVKSKHVCERCFIGYHGARWHPTERLTVCPQVALLICMSTLCHLSPSPPLYPRSFPLLSSIPGKQALISGLMSIFYCVL